MGSPHSYFFNTLLAILGNLHTNLKIKICKNISIFIYIAINLQTE